VARLVAHRELRNNSGEILREVQNGETVEITNHGEVVAVLIPPARGANTPLRTRKAIRRGGFAALQPVRREQRAQDLLDELRGDR
jgi:prevent-host-death family protein